MSHLQVVRRPFQSPNGPSEDRHSTEVHHRRWFPTTGLHLKRRSPMEAVLQHRRRHKGRRHPNRHGDFQVGWDASLEGPQAQVEILYQRVDRLAGAPQTMPV